MYAQAAIIEFKWDISKPELDVNPPRLQSTVIVLEVSCIIPNQKEH